MNFAANQTPKTSSSSEMRYSLLTILLIFMFSGCSNPETEANKLFTDAAALLKETDKNPWGIDKFRKRKSAFALIEKITSDYPSTSMAVKIADGNFALNGKIFNEITGEQKRWIDSALIQAIKGGEKSQVEFLIKEGADVNALTKVGDTPLKVSKTKELYDLLILNGAYESHIKGKLSRTICSENLKTIGLAFRIFAADNSGNFPWHYPDTKGGTAEYAQPKTDKKSMLDADGSPIFDANAWKHYLAVALELDYNPEYLRCPTDNSLVKSETFRTETTDSNLIPLAGRYHAVDPSIGKTADLDLIPFSKDSTGYWLRTDPEVNEMNPDEVMLVCSTCEGGYNVLFCDGSVKFSYLQELTTYLKITNEMSSDSAILP
ncbi:hypothetical protein N8628_00585 [Verrucomicrobia bacterium]|nr:hypothetical protein [Verrucomicrobiota bacterium]